MRIKILHYTPLTIAARAIRKCWNSENKSDSYEGCPACGGKVVTKENLEDYKNHEDYLDYVDDLKHGQEAICLDCDLMLESIDMLESITGEVDRALIDRVGNKLKHKSTLRHVQYVFDCDGVSTKTLLALTRHAIGKDISVQSTRYCTKKRLRNEEPFAYTDDGARRASKYITLTGDEEVDKVLVLQLELSRQLVAKGKANDDIAMTLSQAYKYSFVVTFNIQSLQHFLNLRESRDAHYDIQELAARLREYIPMDHRYLFKEGL